METYFENLTQAQSVMARERVLQDLKTLAHDSEALLLATADDLSEKAKGARARLAGALERAKTTYAELQGQTIAAARAAGRRHSPSARCSVRPPCWPTGRISCKGYLMLTWRLFGWRW